MAGQHAAVLSDVLLLTSIYDVCMCVHADDGVLTPVSVQRGFMKTVMTDKRRS